MAEDERLFRRWNPPPDGKGNPLPVILIFCRQPRKVTCATPSWIDLPSRLVVWALHSAASIPPLAMELGRPSQGLSARSHVGSCSWKQISFHAHEPRSWTAACVF
jgi:hypothetical protein